MEIRHSEKIGQLIAALAKAKPNFAPIVRDQVNLEYMSDYTALATEIAATQDALAAQGIAIVQVPRTLSKPLKNGQHEAWVEISTFMGHSSDEWMAFDLLMPAAQADRFDCQTITAAITYGRRAGYECALSISGQHDDDGNRSAGFPPRNGKKTEQEVPAKVGPQRQSPHQMKLAVGSDNGPYAPPEHAKGGYSL
jgi:ERF superfamily